MHPEEKKRLAQLILKAAQSLATGRASASINFQDPHVQSTYLMCAEEVLEKTGEVFVLLGSTDEEIIGGAAQMLLIELQCVLDEFSVCIEEIV